MLLPAVAGLIQIRVGPASVGSHEDEARIRETPHRLEADPNLKAQFQMGK